MKQYNYRTSGVCSTNISFAIDDDDRLRDSGISRRLQRESEGDRRSGGRHESFRGGGSSGGNTLWF